MTYTVSITSQGQISIPAPLRRKLGLNKHKKALVREDQGRIVVEPVRDLLELRGSLNPKNKPPLSSAEIHEAFANYLATRSIK